MTGEVNGNDANEELLMGMMALPMMSARIWVEAPREVRRARGVARDGEQARETWENVWMPREEAYVAVDDPVSSAHLVEFVSLDSC